MNANNKIHNKSDLPFKPKFFKAAVLSPLLASSAIVGGIIAQASSAAEVAEEAGRARSEELEEVIVEAKVYRHKEAYSGTKMNMALKDIPQTVKVITSDVMDTASMKKFEDVYKLDASGSSSHSIDSFPRNFYRGFRQQGNNTIKVDGFRMGANIDLDLVTFERFEIVKGPVSTIYGQTSVAGTLNAVSKVPEVEFATNLSTEIGTNDYYRAEVDSTGPITDDERFSYRIIAAYEDSDSFLDFAENDVKIISPSISYRINESTDILARINYQEHNDVYHWGSPVKFISENPEDGVEIADIPRSRFLAMPWNNASKDALFVQLVVNHQFDSGWTLKGSFQHSRTSEETYAFYSELSDVNGDSTYMTIYADDVEGELFAGEVNLFGDIEIFGREHTLFIGADYSKQKDTGQEAWSPAADIDDLDAPFNILRPNYSDVAPRLNIDDYSIIYDIHDEQVDIGTTVQLHMRPTDNLSLLLGARYSISRLLEKERIGSTVAEAKAQPFSVLIDEDLEDTTFQAGVIYAITNDINFYLTYGESFDPKRERVFVPGSVVGRLIEPERGTNLELGLKGDIGNNFSFSTAVFDMERTNIAQIDKANRPFLLPIGTQRSRGIELDFSGEVLSGWNVLGSVAVMESEYTEGIFKGLQSSFSPKLGISLYTNYQFQTGLLAGLSIGGGIVHKAGRKMFDAASVQDANLDPSVTGLTLDLEDFTEVDIDIIYEWGNWTVSLGATNVFNEKYYSAAYDRLTDGINVNPGTEISGTIEYDY